jgi:hypothetical protein
LGVCRKAFGLFFITRETEMKKHHLCALIVGASFTPLGAIHAQDNFADSVISYIQGTGGSPTYNTPSAALGAPTASGTINAAAYLNTQIVGIGNGGELTLGFNTPITNDPINHAFGMDFTIFGNDFFISGSNGFSGTYTHPGLSVWVSSDNMTYYQLKVPNGYDADSSFPEQGTGDPGLPVNPAYTLSTFNGLSVSQALALYNGSAGGASYSLSWAQDTGGNAVNLPSISYIEIAGTSGFGYVDAVSRVENVPEPSCAGLVFAGIGVLLSHRRRQVDPNKPNK